MLIVAASVELVGGFQEFEGGLDEPCAVGEVGAGGVEPLGEAASFTCDVVELGFDLGLRQGAVGGEVDQVLLLGVEFAQLAGDLFVQEACGGFLFVDDGVDVRADIRDELGAEPDAGVVAFDGLFDLVDVDVRAGAEALALVAAEEVQVFVAVAVDRALDPEPLVSAGASAVAAVHRALEVVVVNAAAFAGCGPGFDDFLDLVEELLVVDQWLVSAADLLALVVDVAEVVAVAQHLRELVDRDLFCGVPVGGAGAETAVVQFIGQLFEGVVARGVELEGELDQRRAFGVNDDRADHAAFEVIDVVEVAEWCAAEGATVAGFLAHLVGDVGTGLAGLVLVERGQDAVHELADWGVVDGLGGRDQGDVALAQVSHDYRVVVAVTRHARELVDDDDVDIALVADSREHALERFALGHFQC